MDLTPDTLVKAMRPDRTHKGLTYALGRNACPQPFNTMECSDGGLYACRLKHLLLWASIYPDIDHVAVVEIPDDAERKEFDTKIKASALVITRFLPLAEAMALAIQHGADVHSDDDDALCCASYNGHLSVVEFLVAHGADVHALDDDPLRAACESGHTHIVEFLVAHGADVHALDDDPLLAAAEKGHLRVVKFLVAHGANVHALNDIAIHAASANGHTPVADFLRSL